MKPALYLLLTLPLVAQIEDPSAPWAGRAPSTVEVRAAPNGDVEIGITNSSLTPAAVGMVARRIMGCRWEESEYLTGDAELWGWCRKWLHADATYMQGSIDLAPLALGLRAAGSPQVRIRVLGSGLDVAALPKGWRKRTQTTRRLFAFHTDSYTYTASAPGFSDPPPPLAVSEGERWEGARLAAPLLFLAIGPALLAFWLRRRARRMGTMNAAAVWLNWILNGAFLYWMSAVRATDITGFLSTLGLPEVVKLLIGAALYAAPPLAAMGSCLLILDTGASDELEARRRLVKIALLSQAAFIAPLGVFLAGASALGRDTTLSIVCLPAAYALYRVLAWYGARLRFGGLQHVAGGELTERTAAIARAAGARLHGVYILRNRLAREVNAFATGAGVIILTQGLVERLSRRELDAVIAHEAGHLSGRHNGIRSFLFWAYVFLAQPAMSFLTSNFGLPPWIALAPVGPILYIFGVAWISQRHEFDADTRAAAITRDPEGTIAALARLSRITKSPVDWGGMQGSILSHPSMKKRVLAIAARFHMPESRALELLDNPDSLERAAQPAAAAQSLDDAAPLAAVPAAYALPAEFQQVDPVFNSATMQTYIFWVSWLLNFVLIGLLVCLALVIGQLLGPGKAILLYLACTPAVAWVYLRISNLMDRSFRRRLARRIAARVPHPAGAIFVGLMPGPRVRPAGGLYDWDLGFLSLSNHCLVYQGERALFSVARGSIRAFRAQAGPLSWDRTWAVVIEYDGGAFVLRRPDLASSKRKATQFAARLTTWQLGQAGIEAGPAPALPPPDLPVMPPYAPMRGRLAAAHIRKAFMLFMGAALVMSAATHVVVEHPVASLIPLATPLAYLIAVAPMWLRREQA